MRFPIGLSALTVTLLMAASAGAQTQPPPIAAQPQEPSPPATQPPSQIAQQQEPAGPGSPPSSAVPNAPPLQPLPPTTPAGATAPSLAGEPVPPPPPLALNQRSTPEPGMPTGEPQPFYRKAWFWGVIGVVLVTTAVILVASSGSDDPPTPMTTLGNMHAF